MTTRLPLPLLLALALALVLLLQLATPAAARNRALEALSSSTRLHVSAEEASATGFMSRRALAGSVACIVNGDRDDGENKLNVKLIKKMAEGKTVHEMFTQETMKTNNVKAGVYEPMAQFFKDKACTDIFFAGHGMAGKIYFKNDKGKNNGGDFSEVFAQAKALTTGKVHFAACTCDLAAGSDAKLGLCNSGVLLPFIKSDEPGWLLLPAMAPFNWDYYKAHYNPIAELVVKSEGAANLRDEAVNLNKIAADKGAINFLKLGAGGVPSTVAMSAADWKPAQSAPQQRAQAQRACNLGICVIM